MNCRLLLILITLFFTGACGAPDTVVDPWTPPPDGATQEPGQETQAPGTTPTPHVEPTPTPPPWDEYQVISVDMDGAVLDLWVAFEDEAIEITERILDGLVDAGVITELEAFAFLEAAKVLYNQVFDPRWVNENLSKALADQTLDITKRITPGGGNTFLLEYFWWNTSSDPTKALLTSLTGSGQSATGDLAFEITVPTLGEPVTSTMHVVGAQIYVAPLKKNTIAGSVPYSDVETLVLAMTAATMETWDVPPEDQEEYLDQVNAALDDLSQNYATLTLPNGEKALPVDVEYDAQDADAVGQP